jgi:hypothetical protein
MLRRLRLDDGRLADSAYDPLPETRARPSEPCAGAWDDNAAAVMAWIRSGGFPASGREDLLRDVITLWDVFAPDHSAWDTTASFLSALAAMRDAPAGETPALGALAGLATEIEACATGVAGAEERAVAAVRRVAALVSPSVHAVPHD